MKHLLLRPQLRRQTTLPIHRGEQGQAIVEFAMVMPVLVILLLGVVFFAMMFNLQMVLNGAVREGARAWANNRAEASPCCESCTSPCNPLASDNGFNKNIIPVVRKYVRDNGYDGDAVIFPSVEVSTLEIAPNLWQQSSSLSAEDAVKVKLVITYGVRLPTGGLNFLTLRAESTFKRGS